MSAFENFQDISQSAVQLLPECQHILDPGLRELNGKTLVWISARDDEVLSELLGIDMELVSAQETIKIASSDQPASGDAPDIILPPEQARLLEGRTVFRIQPWTQVDKNVISHFQADRVVFSLSKSEPLNPADFEAIQLAVSIGEGKVYCAYPNDVSTDVIDTNTALIADLNVESYVLEAAAAEEQPLVLAIESADQEATRTVLNSSIAELALEIQNGVAERKTYIEALGEDLSNAREYERALTQRKQLQESSRRGRIQWREQMDTIRNELKSIRQKISDDLKPYNGGSVASDIVKHIEKLPNRAVSGKQLDRTLEHIEELTKKRVSKVIADAEEALEKRVYIPARVAVKDYAIEFLEAFFDPDDLEVLHLERVGFDLSPGADDFRTEKWEVQVKIRASRKVFTIVVCISIGVSIGFAVGGVLGAAVLGGIVGGLVGLFGGHKVLIDEAAERTKDKLITGLRSILSETRVQVVDELRSETPMLLQSVELLRGDFISDLAAEIEADIQEKKKNVLHPADQIESVIADTEEEIQGLEALRQKVDEFSASHE